MTDIWEVLIEAGFESGHAYGKAVRTVKSCVGTTWCRYGVQDSVRYAIDLEKRKLYRQFVNTEETEPSIQFIDERGQQRPAYWTKDGQLVQIEGKSSR